MAYMDWRDEFSVDIAQFDDQHKGLFKIINRLFDAMQQGQGESVLGKLLNELELYTLTHFKEEEKYLQKYGYPKLEEHIAEHKVFTDKVTGFKMEFANHKVGLSLDVVQFLKNWLSSHIKIADKEYSKFLLENGI